MSASSRSTFDVALCQAELQPLDDADALTEQMAALVERAGDADCYVFPELLGVAPELDDANEALAILDADQVDALHDFLVETATARDAVVVGGSYNGRDADTDEVRNRAPIATPQGVETYDKSRLIPEERDHGKVAGRAAPPVVEHHGVGVGVLVCYDVEFPGVVRDLVNRGAEVLVVPSWTASEAGYQRVRRCAAARAVENQCYVATVPLVSHVEDMAGVGRASVFAPCDDVHGDAGTRLSLPKTEAAVGTCSLDIESLRRARTAASVRPYTDAREVYRD